MSICVWSIQRKKCFILDHILKYSLLCVFVCVCVTTAYSLVSDVWCMTHCYDCSNAVTVMQLTSMEAYIYATRLFFILQAEAETLKAAFKSPVNVMDSH